MVNSQTRASLILRLGDPADDLTRRRRQVQGSGYSNVQHWLDQQTSEASDVSLWDWNQKQQIFAWAAAKVRHQVNATTWEAFERTSIRGEAVSKVANDLQIREGMVYVARSRVMARLRTAVATWEAGHAGDMPQGDAS